ncbi:MAG: hypothetical protein PQJ35_05915 [Sphaerochaetaceae bacterium]|nr:hypothetical protein [Sphaerochaetaceae bacterium]
MKKRNLSEITLITIYLLITAFSCKSNDVYVSDNKLKRIPIEFNFTAIQEGSIGHIRFEHNLTNPITYYVHLMVTIPGTNLQSRIDDFNAPEKGNDYYFYFPEWLLQEGGKVSGIITVPGHKGIKMPTSHGYIKKYFSINVEPVESAVINQSKNLRNIPRME